MDLFSLSTVWPAVATPLAHVGEFAVRVLQPAVIGAVVAALLTNRASLRRQRQEHEATELRLQRARELEWRRTAYLDAVEKLGRFQEALGRHIYPEAKPFEPVDLEGFIAAFSSLHLFASLDTLRAISPVTAALNISLTALAARRHTYDDLKRAREIWLTVQQENNSRLAQLGDEYMQTVFMPDSHEREAKLDFLEQQIADVRQQRDNAEAHAQDFELRLPAAYCELFAEYVGFVEIFPPATRNAVLAVRKELDFPIDADEYTQLQEAEGRQALTHLRLVLDNIRANLPVTATATEREEAPQAEESTCPGPAE